VVAAARRIVDRHGLGALTMRRLAVDHGVTPNSLTATLPTNPRCSTC
jgi:hypothetical protein